MGAQDRVSPEPDARAKRARTKGVAGGPSPGEGDAPPAVQDRTPTSTIRRILSLPTVEATSTTLRALLVNLVFFLGFFLLVPALAAQLWKNQVVIEPVSVPAALAQMGITPDVAANRIWDGLKDVEAAADTAKSTFVAVPQGRAVDFSIPQSGLSLDSAMSQLRQFLNLFETRISGEFVCATPTCEPQHMRLRLRVLRQTTSIIDLPEVGTTDSRNYFRLAAEGIFSELDPFVAVAALSKTAPDRAVVLARQLVRRRDPDAAWAYNLIGEIEMNRARYTEALNDFEAAVALAPKLIEVQVNRALALANLGRYGEAQSLLDAAGRSAPGSLAVAKGRASVAYMQGDREQAVDYFLLAANLEPDEPRHLVLAGRVELELGKTAAGAAHLNDALAVAPGNAEALEALGNLYYGKYSEPPDFPSAAAMYRNWAQFDPQNTEAWFSLGNALVATGEHQGALDAYDTAIALGEAGDRIMVVRAGTIFGLAIAGVRPVADAIAAFEPLADAEPPIPAVFLSLGKLYAMDGDPVSALSAFRRFLEAAPADHEQRRYAESEVARLMGSQ